MAAKPHIGDIESSNGYKAGDRLIVRSPMLLSLPQKKRIMEGCRQYSGAEVRVLIAECCEMRIVCDKLDGRSVIIAGEEYLSKGLMYGKIQIGGSKVDFDEGDRLTVMFRSQRAGKAAEQNFIAGFREWLGTDHEFMVLWGIKF